MEKAHLLIALMIGTSGCNSSTPAPQTANPPPAPPPVTRVDAPPPPAINPPPPPVVPPDASLPSPTPSASPSPQPVAEVVPNGWNELVMMANSAKTKIDTMAHFNTNRNACGRDAYGAIKSTEDWIKIVKYANLTAQSPARTEAYCTPSDPELDQNGYYKKYMDGTVTMKLPDGTEREIFETRGSDICTLISDPLVSSALLAVLNQVILLADKEDCPNGWGSAVH